MTPRKNHVQREFVSLVETRLRDGRMTVERAAELLIEHRVPTHITARIIARAQQKQPLPTLSTDHQEHTDESPFC